MEPPSPTSMIPADEIKFEHFMENCRETFNFNERLSPSLDIKLESPLLDDPLIETSMGFCDNYVLSPSQEAYLKFDVTVNRKKKLNNLVRRDNDYLDSAREKRSNSTIPSTRKRCRSTKSVTDNDEERSYACDYKNCGLKFASSNLLRQHKVDIHGNIMYFCNFKNCTATFSAKKDLHQHHAQSHSNDQLECNVEECDARFTDKNSLSEHKRNVHHFDNASQQTNIIQCKVGNCFAIFKSLVSLKIHHTNKHVLNNRYKTYALKNYVCDFQDSDQTICSLAFRHKSDLNRHKLECHRAGEMTSYTCAFLNCNLTFLNQQALIKHGQDAHPKQVETFSCKMKNCTSSFSTLLSLQSHAKKHNRWYKKSPDVLYVCDVLGCPLTFKEKRYFNRHKMCTHKIALYVCHYCELAFEDSRELYKHKVVRHDVARAQKGVYACDNEDCHEAFMHRGTLIKHKKSAHQQA